MTRKFSPHVFWTSEEEGILKELYPSTATLRMICEKLPQRSKSQIQNHANQMGVARPVKRKRTAAEVLESKRLMMAQRRAADPDKARTYHREQHHKNRDKNLKKMRDYYGKRFFWGRAMKLRGEGRATTKELASVWKTQRGFCALTGRRLTRSAQLDHITPKSRGGSDSADNLQWVCEAVNLAKRHLTDSEFILLCLEVVTHNKTEAMKSPS